MSPSSQRVWIEILSCTVSETFCPSPSSQRVWIEIIVSILDISVILSPSSQRVWIEISDIFSHSSIIIVALFTEGVDWNTSDIFLPQRLQCRPLHRGCGLKSCISNPMPSANMSPSSQRVWIEISMPLLSPELSKSPSSQRVWIEISLWGLIAAHPIGRPLHRGCGLKFF